MGQICVCVYIYKSDWTKLQAQLLDSFYGIDRGLQASTEVRAEISELITKLEAQNPTPSPNEVIILSPASLHSVLENNPSQGLH